MHKTELAYKFFKDKCISWFISHFVKGSGNFQLCGHKAFIPDIRFRKIFMWKGFAYLMKLHYLLSI